MTSAEETTIVIADRAHKNYENTIRAKSGIESGFIVLGILLQENQRDGLFKFLDYDSFNEYLGAPELGFKRSTAYKLINLVTLYVDKLKVPEDRLIGIGSTKLDAIAKVVENDVEGWLAKAEHLSKSSLDEDIERGRAEGNKPLSSPPPSPSGPTPSGCAICGKPEWEKSHWPCTRGARTPENWWLPMCRECHGGFHADPAGWTWKYKRNWAKYFYERISGTE